MKIDLIRHGEPVGGRKYRGHGIDDPLSEKGWQQMKAAVGDCCDWQGIISSPMRRCAEFAQWLSERCSCPYIIEDHFKEVGFGAWEGYSVQQIRQQDEAAWQAFYQDPIHHRPAGAEPLDQFQARVAQAYERAAANELDHILIVAHAGVIRAILTHVLGAPLISMYRFKIDTAGLCRIERNEQGEQIIYQNRRRL